MSKTNENLAAAFAGESQANRKYLAFARQAEEQGKANVAHLFRAAAEGETVHALSHLKTMGGVKTTEENIEAAIAGETYEIDTMYPAFVSEAEDEGETAALSGFKFALAVEKEHQGLFREALEKVKAGSDLAAAEFFVCQVCGHVHSNEAPEKCPVCGAVREKFRRVE